MDREKEEKNETFEKFALYLAAILGMEWKTYEDLKAHPEDLGKVVRKMHEDPGIMKTIDVIEGLKGGEPGKQVKKEISKKEDLLEKLAVRVSGADADLFTVSTAGDDKTCPACARWQGKTVSQSSGKGYPTIDDYMKSGAFHRNCRCVLKPVKKANNSAAKQNITKEDLEMKEITIQDNGETEVQIATIGTVVGSDADGNPVEQNFTEESLKKIAETQKDDILVDADHDSELGDTTEAKGWLSNLFFKDGVGLFGRVKWTDIGRKLIENRVFRWLSPAWTLNDRMEPERMTSCALTNRPAQAGRIRPVINSKPDEKKDDIEMKEPETPVGDKAVEETPVEEIKETVTAETEEKKEKADEQTELAKENTDVVAEKTDEDGEKLKSLCEQKDADIKAKDEEINALKIQLDDLKREIDATKASKEVKSKAEVIKIDALNSCPSSSQVIDRPQPWKNLHGKEFFDYIAAHKSEL